MFLQWLWPSSVNASVVIALILVIRALLRDRFAIRWTYWLWLFVLVRMLIPWVPQSPTSVFNLWATPESAQTQRLALMGTEGPVQTMITQTAVESATASAPDRSDVPG